MIRLQLAKKICIYMWTIHMNVTKWVGLGVLLGYMYLSKLQAYDWSLSMMDEAIDW
jgi:hypothetical protein